MRILILNQHFYPEVASSGQIMAELGADLVRKGHQVTALTGRPSYRRSDEQEDVFVTSIRPGKNEWRAKTGFFLGVIGTIVPKRILELDSIFDVDIIRTYTYSRDVREDRWRFVQRMVQYLTFFFSSFVTALLLPRHDVVIYLSTPPLLNGVTAFALKLLKGTVGIYNIQDLYPDVAIKLGAVRNRLVIMVCNLLEKFLYSQAAVMVPVGESIARMLIIKGVSTEKINVIPNWMDTDLIRPMGKDTPFSRQYGLVDKFIVMYSGNMGLSQGLETVLKCAELTRDVDIHYLLVGGGASRDSLESMAKDLSLSNVSFLPYQPKERLPESLSAADIHLVPLKEGLSNFSVPSKVHGIMASGRPIIASVDEDSEIAFMFEKAECGVVIKPEDPNALAEAILALYHDRGKLENLGRNGRAYLEKTNTRSICTRKYEEIIERVVS